MTTNTIIHAASMLTVSDFSLTKLADTGSTGCFMVSDHHSNVIAARACLQATGFKPLDKRSPLISVGDDDLAVVREWLNTHQEAWRAENPVETTTNDAFLADPVKALLASAPPLNPELIKGSAEASVPEAYRAQAPAYLRGVKCAQGKAQHQYVPWAHGILAQRAGWTMFSKAIPKWKEGFRDSKRGLPARDEAWIAGYTETAKAMKAAAA